MISKLKRPLFERNIRKTSQELQKNQSDKEDRFQKIALDKTPQQSSSNNSQNNPNYISPQRVLQSPRGKVQFFPASKEIKKQEKKKIEEQNMTTAIDININNPYSYGEHEEIDNEQPNIYIEPVSDNFHFFQSQTVSPVLQVRRNFANDISHAVNASVCSNSMHLFVSVGKIFGYLYVLMGSEASCKFSVSSWLFMMCVHDITYIYYSYLVLRTIKRSDYQVDPTAMGGFIQTPKRNDHSNMRQGREFDTQFMNDLDEWEGQRQINAYAIHERASSSSKSTNTLNEITRIFYILLFIIGNYIILGDTLCVINSPHHYKLAAIYLILGFISLGVPIIIFGSLCLCLPFVLILYVILSRAEGNQQPLRKDILEQLEKIKFNNLFQGNKDCCICMQDYKDGDSVALLPCNRNHNFHYECVKKWLKINGVCPICRQSVEQQIQQLQNLHQ